MASERHLKEKEMKRITLETVGLFVSLLSLLVSLRLSLRSFLVSLERSVMRREGRVAEEETNGATESE